MAIDTLKIFKTREVKTPERSGINAGFDFFVPNDYPESILKPAHQVVVPSAIKVRIPRGHALIAFNKSGIAMHKHLQIGACVIDENYTGIITLHLHNIGTKIQRIFPGMKLVQFILLKVNYADIKVFRNENEMYKNFNTKERGDKGFGSTGI